MDVFAALADPIRRDLLRRLADGPARVVDLAVHHDVSRPAISRHLRVLADAGLVAAADHGRERHYSADPSPLAAVDDLLADVRRSPRSGRRSARRSGRPPIDASALDALDTEVRRTTRERRTKPTPPSREEDIA